MIQFELTPIAKAHCERNRYSPEDMIGIIPFILSEADPRPAVEQLDAGYAHGGGWRPFEGFKLVINGKGNWPELHYPGDPPTVAIAQAKLRDERIILFQHAWVAVVQADGNYVVARMD